MTTGEFTLSALTFGFGNKTETQTVSREIATDVSNLTKLRQALINPETQKPFTVEEMAAEIDRVMRLDFNRMSHEKYPKPLFSAGTLKSYESGEKPLSFNDDLTYVADFLKTTIIDLMNLQKKTSPNPEP